MLHKQYDFAIKEHLDAVQPEKQAKFTKAVNTKNPLLLQTFEERGASIGASLDRIRANPKYQALKPEAQARVRADFYDKYVAPSYEGFHLEVPSKDTWVKLTDKDRNVFGKRNTANSYFEDGATRFATGTAIGADKALTTVALYGLNIENKIFQQLHGIDKSFSAHMPAWYADRTESSFQAEQKKRETLINSQQQHIDGLNFYLNTHPRDGIIGDLGNLTGEVLATLPLYEAISATAGAAIPGTVAAGASRFGKAVTISAKLAATPTGKFVIGTLTKATDGYLSGLIASGGDKTQAEGGAGFMVAGGVLGAAAKESRLLQKVASYPLIKKWTASILSMGGKPFAQDLAASANHEETAIVDHLEGTAQHKQGNTIHFGYGISLTHADENSGHITFMGVNHPYSNPTERQQIYKKVETLAQQVRQIEDPLMAQLHEAEKITQGSVAQQMYSKPLRNLSKAQRARVFAKRLELVNQAAAEAPVHLPEFTAAEKQHEIEQFEKESPEFAAYKADIEKSLGIKVHELVAEDQIDQVATDTGIINAPAVNRNIDKIEAKAKPSALSKEKQEENIRSFASLRSDSVAYFKNSFSSAAKKDGRLAADGTRVGLRDKRSWNEILKSDNTKAFVDELKQADGNKIHFESDTHRMLFHLSNAKSLEKPMVDKLYRELAKADPVFKTRAAAREAADWQLVHLYEGAKHGWLFEEGNVFRSTKVNDPKAWSKWQLQGARESDTEAVAAITKALKRHPKVLQSTTDVMNTLLKAKYEATSVDDYIALDKEFINLANNIKLQYAGRGRIGQVVK